MEINILFVDDDVYFMKDIRKAVKSLNNKWTMHFAKNGREAMSILEEKKNIDLIITNLRMPKMDGAELLGLVKKIYPHIIRIIYSISSDKAMLFNTTNVAHQFFVKNLPPEIFCKKIEKTFFLRKHLHNENLLKLITGMENLPSLPDVFFQLEQALRSPKVSASQVGEIISNDIAMTARILQFVNSPFFGLQNKVTDTVQAVSLLGINTVKSLALHLKVFSAFNLPKNLNFSIEELWIHSYRVATTAKQLVQLTANTQQMMDDANVAGILHDIGKLILCNVPGYFKNVHELMREDNMSYVDAEYKIYGTSHAEVGAYLLAVWGLSDDIVETVAFHHHPSKVNKGNFSVITAVHLANALVHFAPYIDLQHLTDLSLGTNLIDLVKLCKESFKQ